MASAQALASQKLCELFKLEECLSLKRVQHLRDATNRKPWIYFWERKKRCIGCYGTVVVNVSKTKQI
jgi:hypothetical protein